MMDVREHEHDRDRERERELQAVMDLSSAATLMLGTITGEALAVYEAAMSGGRVPPKSMLRGLPAMTRLSRRGYRSATKSVESCTKARHASPRSAARHLRTAREQAANVDVVVDQCEALLRSMR